MPELALVALGVASGLALGATIRAVRRIRRQSVSGAMFLPDVPPTRSAGDLLAGRIRVLLGGQEYVLPVLPRGPSRDWIAALDDTAAATFIALEAAGDDTAQIVKLLLQQTDAELDALIAYDTSHALPSREWIDEHATDSEVMRAVMEVWRAANPKVAIATAVSQTSSTLSERPNMPRIPTDGVPTTSRTTSPTNSSSPTSTLPLTESATTPSRTSPMPSSPSEWEPSSAIAKGRRHTSVGSPDPLPGRKP